MKRKHNILSTFLLAIFLFATPAAVAASEAAARAVAEDVSTPAPEIKINGHGIEIEIADDAEHQVMVYALTGQMVKNTVASYGTTAIELSAGYYIVKVDRITKRVIIR